MTAEEARDDIIQAARSTVAYWANLPGERTCEDRISGAIFSFLCELDGVASLPGCDLIVYDECDEIRVTDMLHEYFYARAT